MKTEVTADYDVCTTFISWTPDCGSTSSNILNSNNKPIKENLQLLSLLLVIQIIPFNSLSNHLSEWKKPLLWTGFETYLKREDPNHLIIQTPKLPLECCPPEKWTQSSQSSCEECKFMGTHCPCALFCRSRKVIPTWRARALLPLCASNSRSGEESLSLDETPLPPTVLPSSDDLSTCGSTCPSPSHPKGVRRGGLYSQSTLPQAVLPASSGLKREAWPSHSQHPHSDLPPSDLSPAPQISVCLVSLFTSVATGSPSLAGLPLTPTF